MTSVGNAVAVAPSTLLRALKKHAARDHDDEAEEENQKLSTGALLGSKQSLEAEESVTQRVTLFGVLNAESDLCVPINALPLDTLRRID